MTLNRDPRIASQATRPQKGSDTEKALKRATTGRKTEPKPKPTLEGITRREGEPEPASKH
jgi:hypothetical protein